MHTIKLLMYGDITTDTETSRLSVKNLLKVSLANHNVTMALPHDRFCPRPINVKTNKSSLFWHGPLCLFIYLFCSTISPLYNNNNNDCKTKAKSYSWKWRRAEI